jgi:hypothetical protein
MRKSFRSYEDVYEDLYGKGGRKAEYEKLFAKQFPEGHTTSIRPAMQECLTAIEQREPIKNWTSGHFLNDIHPEGFKLLVKYGIDYVPHDWDIEEVYTSPLQPEIGQCFSNSYRMMEG